MLPAHLRPSGSATPAVRLMADSFPSHQPFRCAIPRRISAALAIGMVILLGWPARADETEPPVAIRVTWGGGKSVAWSGSIRLIGFPDSPRSPASPAAPPEWRILSADPLATATMHADSGVIVIHEERGLDLNGVEVHVADWRRARLSVELAPADSRDKPVRLDVAVADLVVAPVQHPLDADGNRLTIKRAPGDELRVVLDGAASAIHRPGDTVRLTVHPLLARMATATSPELRLRLRRSAGGAELHAQSAILEAAAEEAARAAGPAPQPFAPVPLAVPLPQQEGAYDIEMELVERGGLRWSRSVAARTVQVVAVADAPPKEPAGDDWRVVYELDPGSPKLLERLRRLPGVSMPSMGMPTVSIPKMPLPSFSMPRVPLPTPSLPNVPVPKIPSVNAMVPGLSGLLSVGHSTLDAHPLGAMLKLPPGGAEPAWEGIALASAEPGRPHLVEIEYPLDQDALVGVCVLEQPAGVVRTTGGSGFEVRRPQISAGAAPKLGVHRFVFWPHTRTPLVLITNLSPRSAASFGRTRILAGPVRVAAAAGLPRQGSSRRVLMHLPTADFSSFGAVDRGGRDASREGAGWDAILRGVQRSAEWASAQGAAGAMLGVYADGAAIWPSTLTQAAPRWGSGGSFDGAPDAAPKDMLDLVCRVYARERLRLVPGIVCNGAVPELEALVAREGGAAGILCVGHDGRPHPQGAGARMVRYNILDPRVQGVVERLVAELADRVGSSSAVDGIAIVLPHDGWLHLPGIAWGLDDATFGRFVAAAGREAAALAAPVLASGDSDGRRFAGRAALVEGPLREQWLTWREAEVAAFYGRLADAVEARNRTWSLYVAPTTLFVEGELAARFRPTLASSPADADVMRSIALDPCQITAHDRIVYVAPHVHAATDDVVERGLVHQANHSLPLLRAAAQAARRGAVFVERPARIDLKPVVSHGPFTTTSAAPADVSAVAVGADARRPLAESLVASDLEVIFDMGLVHRQVDDEDRRRQRAIEVLPAARLEIVEHASAPLVVRTKTGDSGTWVTVVNAGGLDCRAALRCDQTPSAAVDAATQVALPVAPTGEVAVDLAGWETKTIVIEGDRRVVAARPSFSPDLQDQLRRLLADLQRRRSALEAAVPMAVLDNPNFELPQLGGLVPGWELLEPKRGSLALVAGRPTDGGRGARFASVNGLATLRSNPFPPPATGRISVALWVRVAAGEQQPPLRIAIEGVEDDLEFYRFAPVGRGAGAMPVAGEWSQFVLQIDDLPTRGIESLRVRLDLLGPGGIEIDDVRVFDLAFDESQRVQLTKLLAVAEERLAAGDLGGCLIQLDGYWPRFLAERVTAEGPLSSAAAPDAPNASQPNRTGVIDRVRRWWQ
jgi:hypothetical protein